MNGQGITVLGTTRFVFYFLVDNLCAAYFAYWLTLKMESVRSSETSVSFYHVTWYNIAEDNTIFGITAFLGFVYRPVF
jgi:hypothetical protein